MENDDDYENHMETTRYIFRETAGKLISVQDTDKVKTITFAIAVVLSFYRQHAGAHG